jgi:putative ABC transport system ATP-binding protein
LIISVQTIFNRVMAAIEMEQICKSFPGPAGFSALRGVDLQVDAGELVAVVGRSGSGKSTLLNLVAGLDRPSSGQVQVAGTRLGALGEDALSEWRGRSVGVVFQFFQLLPTLTVLENLELPMELRGVVPRAQRRARALALLERVGIVGQADKLPATLSGGEQQRAAIARALVNDPPVIVADEPTGNLDSRTAEAVFALFAGLAAEGKALLVVTHDLALARRAGRVVHLVDGLVVGGEA